MRLSSIQVYPNVVANSIQLVRHCLMHTQSFNSTWHSSVWRRGLNSFSEVRSTEVKRKNILHHNVEADLFDLFHFEGSSSYEKAKVFKDINTIVGNLNENHVCIDVGCGTGFVTSLELQHFKIVVALDICKRMVRITKKRFGNFTGLNLIVCDAENVPLRSETANAISVSSVLHHIPNPSKAISEMSRVLKKDGFLYITREPNDIRFRRLFTLLDAILVKMASFTGRIIFLGKRRRKTRTHKCAGAKKSGDLNYKVVDIHLSSGFNVGELAAFLLVNSLKVISAHSYHWIFSEPASRVNFLLERIPLSRNFGRYISIVSRKTRRTGTLALIQEREAQEKLVLAHALS